MKTLFFTPENGNFNFEKPLFFKSIPKTLRKVKHVMTIKEFRDNRSNNQNRYMWGCVYDTISKDTGYEVEEIHQLMGKKFLAYEKNKEWFVRSTSDLDTKEMEDYLERVRRFASMELNIFIQLPNEKDSFYYEVK